MPVLQTEYLGLPIQSPLVVSASPLSEDIENLKAMERAGAGAVVLFSLFEEQIELEEMGHKEYYTKHIEALPEALQDIAAMTEFKVGASEYIAHIYKAKKSVSIPIIASLNGYYSGGWVHYAKLLEAAGADAIELNTYYLANDSKTSSTEVEQMYIDLIKSVAAEVNIPIAVKISPFFTAMAHVAHDLANAGADALVVFNRFYQPDFDIEAETVAPTIDLSAPEELRLRLRWTALLYGHLNAQLAVTGGVYGYEDLIKCIMAGSQVAMMTSALFKYGIEHIATTLTGLDSWLETHNYQSIDEIRGRLCVYSGTNAAAFERANYMKVLKSY
ncbi:MAG: dihydroorotate dehydrogenase-like protein [Candidatus Promineifilaceae bacterium]|jgi:dihydroorotate dehydrogenase (fumarate)